MGYFQVRYDSRVVNYDRRGFIRLSTEIIHLCVKAVIFQYLRTSNNVNKQLSTRGGGRNSSVDLSVPSILRSWV